MFIICRISKGRVHAVTCLGQGHPRETLDVFFMVVFFSLDIANPIGCIFPTSSSVGNSVLCVPAITVLVLICPTEKGLSCVLSLALVMLCLKFCGNQPGGSWWSQGPFVIDLCQKGPLNPARARKTSLRGGFHPALPMGVPLRGWSQLTGWAVPTWCQCHRKQNVSKGDAGSWQWRCLSRRCWHPTHCEHDLTYLMLSGSTGVKANLRETRCWWNHDRLMSLTQGLWVSQLGDAGPFVLCRSQRRSALPKKHNPHGSSQRQRGTLPEASPSLFLCPKDQLPPCHCCWETDTSREEPQPPSSLAATSELLSFKPHGWRSWPDSARRQSLKPASSSAHSKLNTALLWACTKPPLCRRGSSQTSDLLGCVSPGASSFILFAGLFPLPRKI